MHVISQDSRNPRLKLATFIRRMQQSDYWQQWPHALHYLERGRYRLLHIIDAIPPAPEGLRLLDIGTTPFTFYLHNVFPHHQLASVDLTPLWAPYCQAQGITFHPCDLVEDELPHASEIFDVVIFTEVLEHLDAPPTAMLRKMHRVLKPGGRMIFSVPNLASLQNRVRLLFGHSPLAIWQESSLGVHGQGHLREYTRAEVEQLLTSSGFHITQLTLLQPRVRDAFSRRDISVGWQVVTALYYIASRFPGCQSIIFVECEKHAS
jgi:SAM-dependent methyltransferase